MGSDLLSQQMAELGPDTDPDFWICTSVQPGALHSAGLSPQFQCVIIVDTFLCMYHSLDPNHG